MRTSLECMRESINRRPHVRSRVYPHTVPTCLLFGLFVCSCAQLRSLPLTHTHTRTTHKLPLPAVAVAADRHVIYHRIPECRRCVRYTLVRLRLCNALGTLGHINQYRWNPIIISWPLARIRCLLIQFARPSGCVRGCKVMDHPTTPPSRLPGRRLRVMKFAQSRRAHAYRSGPGITVRR